MYRAWARTAQQGAVASTRRPAIACRCYSADAPAGAEPTPTYSLPHDAFDANPTDAAAAASASMASADPHSRSHSDRPARRTDGAVPNSAAPVPRRRQRQTLSNAEAQAFADLLGEIMPRTAAQPAPSSSASSDTDAANAGLFGIFASEPGSTTSSTAARGVKEGGDVSKVQQALMRKVGYKMGMQLDPSGTGRWTRKARTELTEQEELELDRLREQLLGLKSDHEVLQWGLEKVFGFDKARVNEMMVYPDPNALSVAAAPSSEQQQPQLDSTTPPAYGPQSRLYPDLLLLLFLVLRDTHRNPTCALSLFRLAKSNPFSYVNGCTTAVYLEVLRTHWADGAGDIEAVWQGLDEMRANGVAFDDKVRELVRSIGDAIRIDQERAELRYDHERERGGGAGVEEGEDPTMARERQILSRRWFDASQIGAWSRMERIVEENQDEVEEMRQKREDERWHDSERARRDRFHVERERAHSDRPDLIDRAGSASSSLWAPSPSSTASTSSFPVRRSGITAGADGISHDDDLLLPRGGSRASRPTWETWKVPVAERDEDGNPIMPKRPSFVNPFKIRRKGLTKEEKARKDTRHPALWWKK